MSERDLKIAISGELRALFSGEAWSSLQLEVAGERQRDALKAVAR